MRENILEEIEQKKKEAEELAKMTMEERYSLLRDENNFIALCRECHEKIHGNVKKRK